MPILRVTPVIGTISRDRLNSLQGCHAVHEKAVNTYCNSVDDIAHAISSGIAQVLLARVQRDLEKVRQMHEHEFQFLVTFHTDR